MKTMNVIKTFPLRITQEFHKHLSDAAYNEHLSIHEFIVRAIQEKIQELTKGR
jgi:predicted HicB family RNase H-like nuclease